ncbi:MAG: tetratricopeptide repeat protein [Treponema sp.]|jgi:tetratricopeptide (TPR) repeat protein|nr:tetratricopeptide repeat protein [Treponema sp.]
MPDKKIPPAGGTGQKDQVHPLEKQGKMFKTSDALSRPVPAFPAQPPVRHTTGPGKPNTSARVPGGQPRSGPEGTERGRLREGIRLFRMKRYDMALAELVQVDSTGFSGEENAELAYYLGLCHTKLEHYDEALIYLDQVISTGQSVLRSYQCRMTLSYIYVITKKNKMAEFELALLRKSGFESVQLYTTLAYLAWMRKDIKETVNYYEQALEIDENNATAMNGLGYVLVETNTDLLRGLRLCRRAVDRKPQNAAYMDSLGWACFKNGDLIGARNWLRRALDLAAGEKEIQDHWHIATREDSPRGK